MAITQLRASGAHAGGRYGSFSGRNTARDVDVLTQPHASGAHTGQRYGSFEGRGASSWHPVDALTHGRAFGAHTGRRYGDFFGRQPSVEPPVLPPPAGGTPFLTRLPRHDAQDEESMWLLLIAQMIASGQIH